MSRRSWIGSVGGVALAVLVIFSVSELTRLYGVHLPLREYGPGAWAALGWVALGVLLAGAFRAGKSYPALLWVAAGLLIFAYAAATSVNPLIGIVPSIPGSHWIQMGLGPTAGFVVGVLLVGAILSLLSDSWLTEGGSGGKWFDPASAFGLLLAPLLVSVLGSLQGRFHQAASMQDWREMRWMLVALVLFGGVFGGLLSSAMRRKALGLGALVGIGLLIVTHPLLWRPGADFLAGFLLQARLHALSPAVLVMVGMLLMTVVPVRWESRHRRPSLAKAEMTWT